MTVNTASSTRLLDGLESTIVASVYSLPHGGITAAPSRTLASWQPCFFESGPKPVLVWGLLGNSGNFSTTLPRFWEDQASPFHAFLGFSDWLFAREGRRHGISLARLTELVFDFLVQNRGQPAAEVAAALAADVRRTGRGDLPPPLRPHLTGVPPTAGAGAPAHRSARRARRQARHRESSA